MLSQTVKILLVEDNQGDYSILQNLLSESGINYTLIWKTNLKDGINLLNQNIFDIVLLDLGLPDSTGIATLQTVIQTKTNTAVVVFTGVLDELLGVEMVKQGAQDYIIKGEVGAT
nr:response regulator [Bacteroidota bacterium]